MLPEQPPPDAASSAIVAARGYEAALTPGIVHRGAGVTIFCDKAAATALGSHRVLQGPGKTVT